MHTYQERSVKMKILNYHASFLSHIFLTYAAELSSSINNFIKLTSRGLRPPTFKVHNLVSAVERRVHGWQRFTFSPQFTTFARNYAPM